jgi:hypothetical protein
MQVVVRKVLMLEARAAEEIKARQVPLILVAVVEELPLAKMPQMVAQAL